MGLRSFLKTKVLRRDEKGSGNNKDAAGRPPKKKFKGTVATVATVASEEPVARKVLPNVDIPDTPVAKKPEVKKPVVETESKKMSKLPPIHTETVKEKLNRVRSGMMTDDEKKAFLRTALSAKDTTISRTPLRQKLPDDRVEGDRSAGSNATPFPTLLKNVASGWGKNESRSGEQPLRNWKDGVQMSDQKKKREYFEMVTDPNRFHTYKSSVVTKPGNATEPTEFHDGVILPLVFDEDMEDDEESISVPEVEEDNKGEGYDQKAKVAEDLGSRLEKAAAAQEVAAKAKEKERLEKEKRLEQQRLEQKRRIEELHKKQQLELEKKELELKAKKREEELATEMEKERKRREEEARRREMEAAQDAYWAKKLRAEREAKIDAMSQKQKEDFVKQEALEAQRAAEIAHQESMEQPATPVVTNEEAFKSVKVNSLHDNTHLECAI
jgi:phage-related minor tail protein